MSGARLPAGWLWTTLGEVTLLPRGKIAPALRPELPFIGMDAISPGKMGVASVGRLGNMRSAAIHFRAGDILYGRMRPYLNKVWLASFEGGCSAEFIVFPKAAALNSRFLAFRLHAADFVRFAVAQTSGDRPRVDIEQLRPFRFAFPPLAEQERIADRLDALLSDLDAGMAELDRAKGLLGRYRQAVLRAAVTGELTRAWRERHAGLGESGADLLRRILAKGRKEDSDGFLQPTDLVNPASDAFEEWPLPQGWVWCSVDQVGDVQLGQQRAPQHHSGQHMRPYLRVANVLDDSLDLQDVKWMNFEPKELAKFELKAGDILLNEGQSPDKIGRSAIYQGQVDGCCIQKTLLRFRCAPGILPEFAQIVFRHYVSAGIFRRVARITTNIGHLTRIRFVKMRFPLPPTREQEVISDMVGAVDSEIKHLEQTIDRTSHSALRQSILAAAFRGELVPQDPADEPASVLLERIAAERSGSETTRRRGRPRNHDAAAREQA